MYILVLYILYLLLRRYYFCISQERNSKMCAIKKPWLNNWNLEWVRQRKMHIIDILLGYIVYYNIVYIVLASSTSCRYIKI